MLTSWINKTKVAQTQYRVMNRKKKWNTQWLNTPYCQNNSRITKWGRIKNWRKTIKMSRWLPRNSKKCSWWGVQLIRTNSSKRALAFSWASKIHLSLWIRRRDEMRQTHLLSSGRRRLLNMMSFLLLKSSLISMLRISRKEKTQRLDISHSLSCSPRNLKRLPITHPLPQDKSVESALGSRWLAGN